MHKLVLYIDVLLSKTLFRQIVYLTHSFTPEDLYPPSYLKNDTPVNQQKLADKYISFHSHLHWLLGAGLCWNFPTAPS